MATIKRIGLKRIGLIGAALLVCVVLVASAALALLHTNAVHRYLLGLVTERIQDAIGGRVSIGSFSFHSGRLGADFYQVAIYDSQSDSSTPVFSAERAGIDIGLHLFGARKLVVQDFTLAHPVVHLSIDSRGNSNLPHSNRPTSGPRANLFDIAIDHFILNGGEIFYNDRQTPLTADIYGLNARADYEDLKKTYDTMLSYREGRIRYGTFAPFTHNLELSFAAASSGVELKSLILRTAESWIKAQGTLTNYEMPSVAASYEASVSTKEFANIIGTSRTRSHQTLTGQINTKGTLNYRNMPGEPAINDVSIAGTLSGRTLQLDSASLRLPVQSLTGEYGLKAGVFEARRVEADTLGGHVTAHLVISQITANAAARFDAAVQDIALPAVRDALRARELPGIRMDGHLNGNVQGSWHGSVRNIQLLSNVRLAGTVGSSSVAGGHSDSFSFNGAGQVAYDGNRQIVTVHNTLFDTPHSHLAVDGSLGSNAKLDVEARSEDLHEVDLLVHLFQPNTSGKASDTVPGLLDLGGRATFKGMINGPLANPQFDGILSATSLRVRGASLQYVQASIEANSRGIAVHQGEIRNGPQNRANFDVSVGLQDWDFTPEQPVMIRLNAEKVSVADLEHIAGFQFPITGSLTTTLTVNGTEQNPDIRGNIQVAQASLWQQPVQNLSVQLQNSGSRLLATLNVQAPAGSATGTIDYDPKSREYDLQSNLTGIQLNQIHYFQEHAQELTGVISASAHGRGSMDSPQLDLSVDGQQMQFGEQKVEGFKAQASVDQQRAQFDIECSISGAALRTRGSVNLTGDYQASANIDSQVIQLNPLLQTWLPQAGPDLHGQTEFHGTLTGPLKDFNRLEAHLEVPSLQIGYPSIQFAATGPIHVDYQRGVLEVERAELKGTGTDVTVEASIPLRDAANLSATANGRVDLQLLQLWNPQWKSSGQLNLKVGVQGRRTHPEVSGTATISDGAIAMENVPTLEKIKGELNLTGEGVQVNNLTGLMGGGTFEVHGSATYRPELRYNLGMTAKGVRLLYPDGVRTQLTAELNFIGQPESSNLTGQVTVNSLSLTQSFDLVSFGNQFSGSVPTVGGFAENVKINVSLSSRQQLELANKQLSIQGSADLQVRGTAAEPVLIGRTDLTGGEFFFNGRRFEIQNASIEFANPVRTDPVVNLTATTTVNQFDLTINLVGPFDRLRTTYTSDPPLAPVDVINLLITGQTTEASQQSTTTPETVLAGQLSGQVSDRLQKLTGISSLTIDPQIGGNQPNGASELAIQERVTKNLFFTFATNVTTTQGEVVQVEYQVTRKYSVSAIRDQTGGYEVEIKSRKRF